MQPRFLDDARQTEVGFMNSSAVILSKFLAKRLFKSKDHNSTNLVASR